MPKRDVKKDDVKGTNSVRRNGKKWKGGKAPIDRKPGERGYSGPGVKSKVVPVESA